MRTIVTLILAGALAGCVAQPKRVTHDTKGPAELRQDALACELRAEEAAAPVRNGIEAGYTKARVRGLCMAAAGWRPAQ